MSAHLAADWLVPQWPVPARVRAVCTTRTGGVSAAPYDSLNLGDHVGDAPDAVAVNRARVARALDARPLFLRQVHGTGSLRLDGTEPDGCEADACLTTQAGLACTIMVADCLPVLLATRSGTVVGAAHAGWRGLAGEGGLGVIEALWQQFCRQLNESPLSAARQTLAWLGPCIGPAAFEVGPEVRTAFVAQDAGAAAHFRPGVAGKWLADLPALARHRLRALGITQVYGNDGSTPWCTVSNPSRFFSHRRDRISGRFAACVWLT